MHNQKLGLPSPSFFPFAGRLTIEIFTVCRKVQSIARVPSQRARSASPAQRAHSMAPSKTAIPTNTGRIINIWAVHKFIPAVQLQEIIRTRLLICPYSCISRSVDPCLTLNLFLQKQISDQNHQFLWQLHWQGLRHSQRRHPCSRHQASGFR